MISFQVSQPSSNSWPARKIKAKIHVRSYFSYKTSGCGLKVGGSLKDKSFDKVCLEDSKEGKIRKR